MLNFGLLGRGGKGNACMLQGTNGTKYGYIQADGTGSMNPYQTDGHLLVEVSWQDTGLFILRYQNGAQITNLDEITIKGTLGNTSITTTWNSSTEQYEGIDQVVADELIARFVPFEELCFSLLANLPTLFLHYTFSEIVYEI